MERHIRIERKKDIIGVLYDEKNNVKERGEFTVLKDKNNQLTLKHKGTNKIYSGNKDRFDMGERIPRRLPSKDIDKDKLKEMEKQESAREKNIRENKEKQLSKLQKKQKELEQQLEKERQEEKDKKSKFPIPDTTALVKVTEAHKIVQLINSGIKNIWLVGPAGCGKTTITKEAARELNKPFLPISCGRGTGPSDFIGYKFPTRSATDFGIFLKKPAVILLDEFTALEESVAQIVNAALANGYINTTTGKVYRHRDCVIIATSNTFGTGADTMYVANNQLDASTLDRFTGGILKMNYSESYEKKYDREVREYVQYMRKSISKNFLQRIASTRAMIIGEMLKNNGIHDWKDRLTVSWTPEEREILEEDIKEFKKEDKNKKVSNVKKGVVEDKSEYQKTVTYDNKSR